MERSTTVSRRDILKLGTTFDVAKRRDILWDLQRYISQTTYYLYGPSVSAVAAWQPYVRNFGPNIGHDTGGRIMAAWLDK